MKTQFKMRYYLTRPRCLRVRKGTRPVGNIGKVVVLVQFKVKVELRVYVFRK